MKKHMYLFGKNQVLGSIIAVAAVMFLAAAIFLAPDALRFARRLPSFHTYSSGIRTTEPVSIDLSEELKNAQSIPLFLQTDSRWGAYGYGDDCIATSGCGPTCLSMIRCGLGGDGKWNPYEVSRIVEENGYYKSGYGTSWDCMSEGAELIGLESHNVIFDEYHIIKELQSGSPIICSMAPGDFTTTGHFIVLKGVTEDGRIIINDPNSEENSVKQWDLDVIMSQVRNLWGYSLADKEL